MEISHEVARDHTKNKVLLEYIKQQEENENIFYFDRDYYDFLKRYLLKKEMYFIMIRDLFELFELNDFITEKEYLEEIENLRKYFKGYE
jgi:hypothetical protein